MPDLPAPPAPADQTEFRKHLESTLTAWNVPYRHEDRFWESRNGREAVYGWGTRIDAGAEQEIEVWFDGLDKDIYVSGGRGRYHEWLDLRSLPTVLSDVTAVLREMLQ